MSAKRDTRIRVAEAIRLLLRPDGCTVVQLAQVSKVEDVTAFRILKHLEVNGYATRSGGGKRGSPYVWRWLP